MKPCIGWEAIEECFECGEIDHPTNMHDEEDGWLCHRCYNKRYGIEDYDERTVGDER